MSRGETRVKKGSCCCTLRALTRKRRAASPPGHQTIPESLHERSYKLRSSLGFNPCHEWAALRPRCSRVVLVYLATTAPKTKKAREASDIMMHGRRTRLGGKQPEATMLPRHRLNRQCACTNENYCTHYHKSSWSIGRECKGPMCVWRKTKKRGESNNATTLERNGENAKRRWNCARPSKNEERPWPPALQSAKTRHIFFSSTLVSLLFAWCPSLSCLIYTGCFSLSWDVA